jgi:hypothetical protein
VGPESSAADAAKTALTLLSSPETLISMQRQDSTSAASARIAVAGGLAAEHRPLRDDRHRIVLFPSGKVLARTIGFCGLLERPVHNLPGFTITPGQLLQAVDLVTSGDLAGGGAALRGWNDDDDSRAMFLRALASRPAAVTVAVLRSGGDRRVEGTVTAWLDGGEAGLWRIPPMDVSPLGGADGLDQRALYASVLDVRPTSKAELVDEITEGFPELRAT